MKANGVKDLYLEDCSKVWRVILEDLLQYIVIQTMVHAEWLEMKKNAFTIRHDQESAFISFTEYFEAIKKNNLNNLLCYLVIVYQKILIVRQSSCFLERKSSKHDLSILGPIVQKHNPHRWHVLQNKKTDFLQWDAHRILVFEQALDSFMT